MKKSILLAAGVLSAMLGLSSCNESSGKNQGAHWAGCRASEYGVNPFPTARQWTTYINKMKSYYPESTGALIWIVGTVSESNWTCRLNFPYDGEASENIRFDDEDNNEEALNAFDRAGYDVWLQVESGNCDINELATIILNKYKNHKCVKGFGVDVEWYKPEGTDGRGSKLTDAAAKKIDQTVKAINPDYSVFVKHWDSRWLPPTYRSDMIFVNDSQQFASLEDMRGDFQGWAEHYAPNGVFFQIGYEDDRELWKTFSNPAGDLGNFLLQDYNNPDQNCGIIWVDFTLKEVL